MQLLHPQNIWIVLSQPEPIGEKTQAVMVNMSEHGEHYYINKNLQLKKVVEGQG